MKTLIKKSMRISELSLKTKNLRDAFSSHNTFCKQQCRSKFLEMVYKNKGTQNLQSFESLAPSGEACPCVGSRRFSQRGKSGWGVHTAHSQWGRRLEGWPNTAALPARQMWFCTWWTGLAACLFHTVPVALTGAAQLRAHGISSCCYIVRMYVNKHPSWATSRKEGMAWFSRRTMPSLWACRPGPWLAVATIFIDSNLQLQYTRLPPLSPTGENYTLPCGRERGGGYLCRT